MFVIIPQPRYAFRGLFSSLKIWEKPWELVQRQSFFTSYVSSYPLRQVIQAVHAYINLFDCIHCQNGTKYNSI